MQLVYFVEAKNPLLHACFYAMLLRQKNKSFKNSGGTYFAACFQGPNIGILKQMTVSKTRYDS